MARSGRPRIEINWDGMEEECKLFAKDLVESILGFETPIFIDPVKKVRKIILSLPKEEVYFWVGSIFIPKQKRSLKSRLNSAVCAWTKKYNNDKSINHFDFCGFSIDELIFNVESKFEPWMNWDNWGQWHIDHIIPRSLYGKPYKKEEVFGLKNLRPIRKSENLKKSNKVLFNV